MMAAIIAGLTVTEETVSLMDIEPLEESTLEETVVTVEEKTVIMVEDEAVVTAGEEQTNNTGASSSSAQPLTKKNLKTKAHFTEPMPGLHPAYGLEGLSRTANGQE